MTDELRGEGVLVTSHVTLSHQICGPQMHDIQAMGSGKPSGILGPTRALHLKSGTQ